MFLRSSAEKRSKTRLSSSIKCGQQIAGRPGIARIVARRQAPFREVHHDVRGAGREARADVLLTFVDDVVLELLARITRQIAIERVKEIHHRWRDHRLMERLAGHLDRLFDELARVEIVAKRAAGDLGQLAIVAIGKDREILSSGRQVGRQSGTGERVGDRIGGEARDALLAVRDDRRACRFEALERIGDGGVLLLFQLVLGDLLRVVSQRRPAAASAAAELSRPARWGYPWQSVDCIPSLYLPAFCW